MNFFCSSEKNSPSTIYHFEKVSIFASDLSIHTHMDKYVTSPHQHPLSQQVIEAKVSDFFRRYYPTFSVKNLPPTWRTVVSFTLWYHFGYTAREIATFLGAHRATIYRDLERGGFIVARTMKYTGNVRRLVEYIYKFV